MSSLTTTANVATRTDIAEATEVHDNATYANNSPMSKTSDQDMDSDGSEELGKHLESFINDADTKDNSRQKKFLSVAIIPFFDHPHLPEPL